MRVVFVAVRRNHLLHRCNVFLVASFSIDKWCVGADKSEGGDEQSKKKRGRRVEHANLPQSTDTNFSAWFILDTLKRPVTSLQEAVIHHHQFDGVVSRSANRCPFFTVKCQ